MAGEPLLQQAQALHRQGRLADAKALYDRILAAQPDHPAALLGLGLLAYQGAELVIADQLLARASVAGPHDPAVHFHRGNLLNRMGRHEEALASYDRALALRPSPAAHANRGVVLEQMGRLPDAIAAFDQAIAAKPDFAAAHFNRGNVLQQVERFTEALESYDRVLALQPTNAEGWTNRGNALKALGRDGEALASYDRALALNSDLAQAHLGRGLGLNAQTRRREALESFDRAITLDPALAGAWLERANVLFELRQLDDAMTAYARALALQPGMAEAHLGRANVLYLGRQLDEALAGYDQALARDATLENAWLGRGNSLRQLQRHDEAAEAYARLLAVNPNHAFAKGTLLHQKMLACDWDGTDALIADISRDLVDAKLSAEPFGWQGVSSDPASLIRCAQLFARALYPALASAAHSPVREGKIRIGYLSGEFRDQATSQLLVGVLEQHDRGRFEICAFDNGRDDGSQTRRRLGRALDAIIPIAGLDDDQAAGAISARGIDILVNLNGYFGDHRMAVFARRPAPIQVNWLGFPGTLGADYMDYIIADGVVIPESETGFFAEKIAWLPDCYQPNDDKKPIAETPTRAQHDLPQDAFVFCCFNNNYKTVPATFARWMRILAGLPDSVLWLMQDNAAAQANLKKQAQAQGVDPARLVFAPRVALPQHLARHRLADLFLDTLPYNAHTTASDALWVGLPLLTCRGSAFAGRVAASLLTAVGLPELIAQTPDQYETMALALAREPQKLAALKRRLAANRLTQPLFDTGRFTRHLEAAYTAMQARRRAGLAPDHIRVPAISPAQA